MTFPLGSLEKVTKVTAVAGAVASVTSVVSGAAAGLSSIGGVLGGLASLGLKSVGVKLPMENPLNKYASWNYIFTLIVLDTASYNFPDKTYIKGRSKSPIILKSGSGSPNNRVNTDLGRHEFYMEDLQIESTIGLKQGLGNTNATGFEFTIKEPMSMGGFMIALQQSAYKAGYDNFRQAVYCIIVEFKGETESGAMSTVPNTTRFLPFKFRDIHMNVSEGGAEYKCTGMAASEEAFLSSNVNITSTVQIVGTTVQEMLQTGPQSLQAVLNERLRATAKAANIPHADEIAIIFPPKQETANSGGEAAGSKEGKVIPPAGPVAKAEDIAPDAITSKLGITRSDKNQSLVQSGAVNELGSSSMGYGPEREGSSTSVPTDKAYDKTAKEAKPANISKDPKSTSYRFKQDTSIVNIINEVLLTSEYGAKKLKVDPDENGMRDWWVIQPQVYHIDVKDNLTKTGKKPELIVYRVVPYKTHVLSQSIPGSASKSFKPLLAQCVKVYNYIYTGKNTDIIKFNIQFDNTWTTIMQNDSYRNAKDMKRAAQENSTQGKQQDIVTSEGGTPTPSFFSAIAKWAGTKTSSDYIGGGGQETEEHRAARTFHDAITYGNEMAMCEMEIIGDPYYLTGSGMGNYNAPATQYTNLAGDMSMNYQNGEVDIALTFKTPTDFSESTGLYNLKGAKALQQFAGIWKVVTVKHKFSGGQFTQILDLTRRPMTPQDNDDIVLSTKKTVTHQQDQTAAANAAAKKDAVKQQDAGGV